MPESFNDDDEKSMSIETASTPETADTPAPDGLPQIEELNDEDRQELIVLKTKALIKNLVWFVVSESDQDSKLPEKIAEINKLLTAIGIHYSNSSAETFSDIEIELFHKLALLKSGDPADFAEFIKLVLSLHLSFQSKLSQDYKDMVDFPSDIQVKLFLITVNAKLSVFLRKKDYESLLELGVLCASFNKIVNDNQDAFVENYIAVTQLSNKLDIFVYDNFFKKTGLFDLEKAEELLSETRGLLKNLGFSVQ